MTMQDITRIGNYALGAVIGRGALGVVHVATDLAGGREVALEAAPRDHPDVARVIDAARSSMRLHHPNILAITDVGETDRLGYVVSDLPPSVSVAIRLEAGAALTLSEIVRLMHGLLDALQYGHENGVAHGAVALSQLFLAEDGEVKLAPFGRVPSAAMADDATRIAGVADVRDGDVAADLRACGEILAALLAMPPARDDHPTTEIRGRLAAIAAAARAVAPDAGFASAAALRAAIDDACGDPAVDPATVIMPPDRVTDDPARTVIVPATTRAAEETMSLREHDYAVVPPDDARPDPAQDVGSGAWTSTDATMFASAPPRPPAATGSAPPSVPAIDAAPRRGSILMIGGGLVAAIAVAVIGFVMLPRSQSLSGIEAPDTPAPPAAPTPAAPMPAAPMTANPGLSAAPSATVAGRAAPDPRPAWREIVGRAIATVPCALFRGDVSPQGDVVLVGLTALGDASQADVTSALRQTIARSMPVASMNWRLTRVDGPYCAVLQLAQPHAAAFGAFSGPLGLTVAAPGADDGLAPMRLTVPSDMTALRLDRFTPDGKVVHLRRAASIADGPPIPDAIAAHAGDLVLAVATAVATPATPAAARPDTEEAAQYLVQLRAELGRLRADGARVLADVAAVGPVAP